MIAKKTWHKPPKKLYLIVDRGEIPTVCDVLLRKAEALRDLKTPALIGDEEARLYEYVLVPKPIKESKSKK